MNKGILSFFEKEKSEEEKQREKDIEEIKKLQKNCTHEFRQQICGGSYSELHDGYYCIHCLKRIH